jgi:biofilm PGA synthesis N-glycosyltransferase PgaC
MGEPYPSYVLVTPARNEARHIAGTIRSVIAQTVPPRRWAIVSDGSTDGTDAIVSEYVAAYPWITLVRTPEHPHRDFRAKVRAFNAGYAVLRDVEHDVVGNLDADITFEPDYFESLLARFAEDPRLGVAGTPFVESGTSYDYRFASLEHVSGACQLFRRQCFEEIGGYVPIPGGGVDWVAVTTARMKGWRTRTFIERSCQHHRPMGTASGRVTAWFMRGQQDYYLGGRLLWQVPRACFQMTRRPYIGGGLLLLAGYLSALLTRTPRPVPSALIEFHRREQVDRLRRVLRAGFGRGLQPGRRRMITAYTEAAFQHCVLLERNRSRRSDRPFLLVLVDMQAGLRDGETVRPAVALAALTALSSCVRETDLVGWYRDGRVAGAMLTELRDGLPHEVAALIARRLGAALSGGLASTARLRVTVCCGAGLDTNDRNPCERAEPQPERARCSPSA